MTGATADGKAVPNNCSNWLSASAGKARVGHHGRLGPNANPSANAWNSAHDSNGCAPADLPYWGSSGRIYCFAADVP